MKKVLLTFGIASLGFTAAFAQDMGQPQEDMQTPASTEMGAPDSDLDNSGRELIEAEALPEAINEALKAEEYTAMTVSEIYKVKEEASASKIYEVHLESTEGEPTVVKFSEDGQVVELEEVQY